MIGQIDIFYPFDERVMHCAGNDGKPAANFLGVSQRIAVSVGVISSFFLRIIFMLTVFALRILPRGEGFAGAA
jgi:hypothetical protein